MTKKFKKSTCVLFFLTLIFFVPCYAQKSSSGETQWVLAAEQFSFTQKSERSSAENGAATLLPQLILEQMSGSSVRMTSAQEMLDRKLNELQTARISLFLQLTKEVKVRDSLLLSESDSKKLQAAIKSENKKIEEIQKKIDENLADCEKAKEEARLMMERELSEKQSLEENADFVKPETKERGFFPFGSFFASQEKSVVSLPSEETVTLYKNDSSQLFAAPESAVKAGHESREYETAVTKASINGLITGSLTIYGGYAMVTATLRIYPGGSEAGTITEVGTLDNCVQIAQNIAAYLVPKITNTFQITILLDITPPECVEKAQVSFDGIVYQTVPEKLLAESGMHTIEVSCPGYNSQSITYEFKRGRLFRAHIPLDETKNAELSVNVKNPEKGKLYADGIFSGEIAFDSVGSNLFVTGEPVIGQFISDRRAVRKVEKEIKDEDGTTRKVTELEEGDFLSSFFYIPSGVQLDGAELIINPKPQDNSSVIDKRRVWMYRGYSALVVTIPFLLYSTGRYVSTYNAYAVYSDSGITADEVNMWNNIRLASVGVSVAAGTFFFVELVRYLHAASAVLPVKARNARNGEVEKAFALARKNIVNPDDAGSDGVPGDGVSDAAVSDGAGVSAGGDVTSRAEESRVSQ